MPSGRGRRCGCYATASPPWEAAGGVVRAVCNHCILPGACQDVHKWLTGLAARSKALGNWASNVQRQAVLQVRKAISAPAQVLLVLAQHCRLRRLRSTLASCSLRRSFSMRCASRLLACHACRWTSSNLCHAGSEAYSRLLNSCLRLMASFFKAVRLYLLLSVGMCAVRAVRSTASTRVDLSLAVSLSGDLLFTQATSTAPNYLSHY
eukprot:COSAG01_NODE_1272_length_10952_cov_8.029301_4_plen_207_part_00